MSLVDLSNATIQGIIDPTGFTDSEIRLNNTRFDFTGTLFEYTDAFDLDTTVTFAIGDSAAVEFKSTLSRTYTSAHSITLIPYTIGSSVAVTSDRSVALEIGGISTFKVVVGLIPNVYYAANILPSDDSTYPFTTGGTPQNLHVQSTGFPRRYEYFVEGMSYKVDFSDTSDVTVTYGNIATGTCYLTPTIDGTDSSDRLVDISCTLKLDVGGIYNIQDNTYPYNGKVQNFKRVGTLQDTTGAALTNVSFVSEFNTGSIILTDAFNGTNWSLKGSSLISAYSTGTTQYTLNYNVLILYGYCITDDTPYNCTELHTRFMDHYTTVDYITPTTGIGIVNCTTWVEGYFDWAWANTGITGITDISKYGTPPESNFIVNTMDTVSTIKGGPHVVNYVNTADKTISNNSSWKIYNLNGGTMTLDGTVDLYTIEQGTLTVNGYIGAVQYIYSPDYPVVFDVEYNTDYTPETYGYTGDFLYVDAPTSANASGTITIDESDTNVQQSMYIKFAAQNNVIVDIKEHSQGAYIVGRNINLVSEIQAPWDKEPLATLEGPYCSVRGTFNTLMIYDQHDTDGQGGQTITPTIVTLVGNVLVGQVEYTSGTIIPNNYHMIDLSLTKSGFDASIDYYNTPNPETFTGTGDETRYLIALWYLDNHVDGQTDTYVKPVYTFTDSKPSGLLTLYLGEVQTIAGIVFDNTIEVHLAGSTDASESDLTLRGGGDVYVDDETEVRWLTVDPEITIHDPDGKLGSRVIDATIEALIYYRITLVGMDYIDTPRGERVIYENAGQGAGGNTATFVIQTLY